MPRRVSLVKPAWLDFNNTHTVLRPTGHNCDSVAKNIARSGDPTNVLPASLNLTRQDSAPFRRTPIFTISKLEPERMRGVT